MNNIEDYRNLVELLKKTLEFYANKTTYGHFMGNPSLIDLDEHGFQARFALEKIKEINETYEAIESNYISSIKIEDETDDFDAFEKNIILNKINQK